LFISGLFETLLAPGTINVRLAAIAPHSVISWSLILLLLGFGFVSICVGGVQARSGTPVVGRYTNGDYGYTVTIPRNLTAFRASAPAPNHGFDINLSEAPQSYLWVDASFDVLEYSGTLAEWTVHSLRERGASKATIRNQSSTSLGGLSAVRIIIDYELKGAAMVSETVNARRGPKGKGVGIVYSINLECAKKRFDQDSGVVEMIRREWRLLNNE
jgi:hypothetical protein